MKILKMCYVRLQIIVRLKILSILPIYLSMQKRSGGNMIEIIRDTASTIRQKAEVEQEIQTIISGKKMEVKVMQIMPFAMIGYLRITSPEFLVSLYGNAAGIIVMFICLFIYAIAVWFAKEDNRN